MRFPLSLSLSLSSGDFRETRYEERKKKEPAGGTSNKLSRFRATSDE